MKKIFILTGEPSGDKLASTVILKLMTQNPNVEYLSVGGSNIKKLGKIGDLVEVKNGYARNFLFPNNMALRDSKKNLDHYNKIK